MLPVAFDLSRILADEIAAKYAHNSIHRFWIRPTRRLAESDVAMVDGDADKVRAA
jgi:hypothetical protein